MKMTVTNFDEMQIAQRHRTATMTAVLMGVLVLANGIICDRWHVWGSGLDQAFAIVFLAASFYVARVIWHHAYFSRRMRVGWILAVFGIMTGIWVVILTAQAVNGELGFWENGHAGPTWQVLMLLIFFVTVLVTYAVRAWTDRRAAVGEAGQAPW